ncbi:MAG: AAA family ATPase, partial [Spirochaetales bacterium]
MSGMSFYADLHIHSRYSIAVSKDMVPVKMDYWSRIKGVEVLGTGDCTHPGWLADLQEALEPAGPGVFRLKPELRKAHDEYPSLPFVPPAADMRFLLTGEVSTIYKWDGRVRKVHHVVLLPGFEEALKFQSRLGRVGNITSDGRPILGLDSRDLLEILLEASPEALLIPAHIWTPWFSAMGDKSGFDSIAECYRDLSGHITAIETGLSSDPAMNWCVSSLDNYSIVSNSDAHSPENIGREATVFSCTPDFFSIKAALAGAGAAGTLEFFPQEGKYHYDGHRKCGVCFNPEQTLEHKEICPACGKRLTVGVMHRVIELCDRRDILHAIVSEGEVLPPPGRPSYRSLIPLKELLSELAGVGPKSKKVTEAYNSLLRRAGAEFALLLDLDGDALKSLGGDGLAEAVTRMRRCEVRIEEGYDGEYGKITVFAPGEEAGRSSGSGVLFPLSARGESKKKPSVNLKRMADGLASRIRMPEPESPPHSILSMETLNPAQREAAECASGRQLIIAGPGTGKTKTLAHKIAWLIREKGAAPDTIAALTFTNKAAEEMKGRIAQLLLPRTGGDPIAAVSEVEGVLPWISTFHMFGLGVLSLLDKDFRGRTVIDAGERSMLLENLTGAGKKESALLSSRIENVKQNLLAPGEVEDGALRGVFESYQQAMETWRFLDIDDLIYLPCLLMREDKQLQRKIQSRFSWIVVDEYQDINAAQYAFISLTASGPGTGLCVIGDPDQAIYGFRGADAGFIRRFTDDYPGAAVFRLSQSYRCAQNILDAASAVLEKGAGDIGGNTPVSAIGFTEHGSDKSEAEHIARSIESLCGGMRFFSMDSGVSLPKGGGDAGIETSPSGIAVLVRTGRQMEALEKAFRDHAIPWVKSGEVPYYQEGPLLAVVSALKAAVLGKNSGFWQTAQPDTLKLAEFMMREGVPGMSADSLARWIKEHTEAGLSKDCLVHIEWLKSDIRDSGSLKK